MHWQALYSKEVEEVENPENLGGRTMYRYTVYTESEGTTHKKTIRQDKDKVMDPMDLDFSFDYGFGIESQGIHPCIGQHGGWQEGVTKAPWVQWQTGQWQP